LPAPITGKNQLNLSRRGANTVTTAALTRSGASASGLAEDKRSGILAEVISVVVAAGVIAQLIAYSVANKFYSAYGLNVSVVGITPTNAAFRLSDIWILSALLVIPPSIGVFIFTSWHLRKHERGDPDADEVFLPIFHNMTSWRFFRVGFAMLALAGVLLSTQLLLRTSERVGYNFAREIDPLTLTPNSALPDRLIEKAANASVLPWLGLALLPTRVEVSWPTIDKVPVSLSGEWPPPGNSSLSPDTGDAASSSGGIFGEEPPPGVAPAPPGLTPGPSMGIPAGPAPNEFSAQWLGDYGNCHVLYFPDYHKTLFVKIDDVGISVSLPRS